MRKQNTEFKTAFTSEANQKLKNTDSFGFVELDRFACYVIADGIDDNLDAVSARLAVDTVISTFMEAPSLRRGTLRRCLRAANRALVTANSKMKLKASVTVLVTDYMKLRYGQAGNTRFRLYRDGFQKFQSRDDSLSMDLVQGGQLEPDKLVRHEQRHNLYRYLGQDRGFSPYISKKIQLSNADAAALLTRGIWEHLDDGELKDVFADATDDPQPTVDGVEDLLLSRQPEGLETYTFAAIFFNKVFVDPNRKRTIQKAIMIAIPILAVLLALTIVLLLLYNNRKKNTAAMEQSFYDTVEYIQADNYPRAKEECQKVLELAEQLKREDVRNDTSNYLKLIESVLSGDEHLDAGSYGEAQRDFRNALTRSRYADNLGREYIDSRLEQNAAYMSVYDMISLGDTLALNLQYDKAEEQYLAAKALSGRLYFDQGRADAMAALEQLYADQKAGLEEAADAAQQTAEDQSAAAGILSEGDASFATEDYLTAQAFYAAALQKYTELGDEAQAAVLAVKLAATEEKLLARQERQAEGGEYMRQAEERYAGKDYLQAKKYYLLARDVYAGLKDDDKVAEVTRRLELIEMGISEEERLAREAAEAEARAREEADAQASEEAEAEQGGTETPPSPEPAA